MAKRFLNKTKKIRLYKRAIISSFLLISLISFSFAEDLPTGVFSMQECRECLIKFYRFEAIDEKLLASSAEKLEGVIFSFLNARSPSERDTLFRAEGTPYSERIERFDPSVSRGSIRAYREVRFERAKNAYSIKRLMFKTFGVYILSMLTLFLPFMI